MSVSVSEVGGYAVLGECEEGCMEREVECKACGPNPVVDMHI